MFVALSNLILFIFRSTIFNFPPTQRDTQHKNKTENRTSHSQNEEKSDTTADTRTQSNNQLEFFCLKKIKKKMKLIASCNLIVFGNTKRLACMCSL